MNSNSRILGGFSVFLLAAILLPMNPFDVLSASASETSAFADEPSTAGKRLQAILKSRGSSQSDLQTIPPLTNTQKESIRNQQQSDGGSARSAGAGTQAVQEAGVYGRRVNDPATDKNIGQDTQSETAIVLGTPPNVVAAYNDSASLRWFRQPEISTDEFGQIKLLGDQFFILNTKFTGVSTSPDRGNTWTDKGALPTSPGGDSGDPVLARDIFSGRVYLTTLDFETGETIRTFISLNNGKTFLPGVSSAPGLEGQNLFCDKPWITVDNVFDDVGTHNVYMACRNFVVDPFEPYATNSLGIVFFRSLDGAATWGPSQGVLISQEGHGPFVTVDTDHNVYVFWYQNNTSTSSIYMRRSSDFGVSFDEVIEVATLNTTGRNGDLGLEFRSNAFPYAAVNPQSGHLYLVFNDSDEGDRANAYLTISTDGGATWSPKTLVNDDLTTNDQFFPNIAVTPDGTRLGITWYDRRRDPDNQLIDRYGVVGEIFDTEIFLGHNFRISSKGFPVVTGSDPFIRTTYMGDYDMIDADEDFFYVIWSDNGDFDRAKRRYQQNVRFARVPVTGREIVLDASEVELTSTDGDSSIDFHECNYLRIFVKHEGVSEPQDFETGLNGLRFGTGKLISLTPGVTVQQGFSRSAFGYSGDTAIPIIAPGETAVNVDPFIIRTSKSYKCRPEVKFALEIFVEDRKFVLPVNIPTEEATAVPFNSPNVPLNFSFTPNVTTNLTKVIVVDGQSLPVYEFKGSKIDSHVQVAGINSRLSKVMVEVNVDFTQPYGARLVLMGPDGTQVNLTDTFFDLTALSLGRACTEQVTFDEDAHDSISTGLEERESTEAHPVPAAVGTFRPVQTLTLFKNKAGSAVNGIWRLQVVDKYGFSTGTINCWKLILVPTTCDDAGGECPPVVESEMASF